ncbi:hypothetical protein D3C77_615820 [compost metagenome]
MFLLKVYFIQYFWLELFNDVAVRVGNFTDEMRLHSFALISQGSRKLGQLHRGIFPLLAE